MEITDLTPAEHRVWQAFPLGAGVDFRESTDDDPATGAGWGPERTIRAEVLRALLLNGPDPEGEIAGLKLWGARITGRLDLKYGTVEHPLRLRSCHFEQPLDLYGAQLRVLALNDSVLPGLIAGQLRVDGVLRLTCCRIKGTARLAGAQISGAVFLNGAHFGDPDATEPTEESVVHLNHADIGTDLWAPDMVAHGQVRLNGATVGRQVNLNDARLNAPGGHALQAETLSVGTDLHAMRLRARGRVDLRGARVSGQLNFAYAALTNPGGVALRVSSCTAGEMWLRQAQPVVGAVNLRRAQFDVLFVPPEVWPDEVKLDRLTYGSLLPHLPAEERLPVLDRERGGYVSYSYEQLAAAYRTAGDEGAARAVQLAKLRRHRRTLPWYARVWGHLQDTTVGYGYRPMRAAGWLLALLLIGAVAFALHHPRPLKTDEAPDFNPFFYTLDLLMPIIGFGQEAAFAPHGWYQWLSYLLVVTGWTLATTIAAGITRSLTRQ
ncbi:membrane-associated oxidoreductase [Streptomyces albus subsp. albus]|nr:membrane-associated oxidoreductase [Streptomyces albus subsp. albus]